MLDSLPPSEYIHTYEIDAMLRRSDPLIAVLGTGSMQPYIPSGNGVVAWCLVERCAYDLLGEGDVVVYHTGGSNILHQLSAMTPDGWIASGLHNRNYDSPRVTRANFSGRVVKTYIILK